MSLLKTFVGEALPSSLIIVEILLNGIFGTLIFKWIQVWFPTLKHREEEYSNDCVLAVYRSTVTFLKDHYTFYVGLLDALFSVVLGALQIYSSSQMYHVFVEPLNPCVLLLLYCRWIPETFIYPILNNFFSKEHGLYFSVSLFDHCSEWSFWVVHSVFVNVLFSIPQVFIKIIWD